MNLVVHSLVFGVLIPLVAGGLCFGIPLVLLLKSSTTTHTSGVGDNRLAWLGGLGLAAGYMAGYIGLLGIPKWADAEAILWLIWLLPGAVGLAIWDTVYRPSFALRWAFRTALLGFLFWLMFRQQVTNEVWTTQKLYTQLALFTSLGSLFWFFWEVGTAPLSELQSAWLGLVFSSLTSVLLALSGSAKYAQLFGASVSVLGVWWVLAWWAQQRQLPISWLRGILPVLVFFLFGFTLAGHFYADVSVLTASMLLLSPLLLALSPRWFAPQTPWPKIAYLSALLLLPLLLALATLAYKELAKPKDSPYYYSR